MSQMSDAVAGGEREPEPSGGRRHRTAALAVAVAAATAGTAIAVCIVVRRPGHPEAGPPVTQIGFLNIASQPDVYRPVLRAGSRRHRARRRGTQVPEATGTSQARRRGRPRP